ncbi:hypothetical protein WS51_01850 [Burkholderia territorii]|nr:hypothetical protein WS51_01850 [Burkholderia territorii]
MEGASFMPVAQGAASCRPPSSIVACAHARRAPRMLPRVRRRPMRASRRSVSRMSIRWLSSDE